MVKTALTLGELLYARHTSEELAMIVDMSMSVIKLLFGWFIIWMEKGLQYQ